MVRRLLLLPFLLIGALAGFSGEAAAKQCIYNDSGAVLKVYWYNHNGHHDHNATNESLSAGFQACQNNDNLGFAEIKCSGCIFAEAAAKTSIVAAGTSAFGVCLLATGGGCGFAGEIFADAVVEAVQAVPPAFDGKMIVVPDHGKTIRIGGNAFGLKVE